MDLTKAIILIISSIFCTLGFALFFRTTKRNIPWIVLSGVLTCVVYTASCYFFTHEFFQNFISSLFASAFSEILARKTKAPSTSYIACSVVILIPGSKLYYSMYNFIIGDIPLFRENLISLLRITSGLAVGIVIVTVIVRELNRKKYKIVNKISD